MKTTTVDFKKRLDAVRRAATTDADGALVALEKMLKTWPDHPRLLVEKSRLIQVSEQGELVEAKRALKRAIEVGENSPEPWIELGYYLLVVEDRVDKGEDQFDRAVEVGLGHLIQAVTGKIYAILDRDGPLPSEKLADAADLVRLGHILAERYGRNDSPEVRWFHEVISENRERLGKTPKSGRNGRNGP